MAKYCGNCGTRLDDAAKVCGNCGTPLEVNRTNSNNISGISYVDPEKRAKIKKKVKKFICLTIFVFVVIVAINIISGFVGYKGVANKIMKAYKNYDLDTVVSMSSDYYYYMEDESYAIGYFSKNIAADMDKFESQVGPKYKLSYEITDNYKMSEYKFEDLLKTLSFGSEFDTDIISKVKVVEVTVTAKEGKNKLTQKIELILTKEAGSWRLLYIQ